MCSTVRQQGDALPDVTVSLMGLTGPSGVLPRYYSQIVTQTIRARSTALRDFLDLLAHRFVAFFARAGIKYRPARSAEAALLRKVIGPDQVAQVLLALTGYGTAHLTDRLAAGAEPLLHYAGLFALRPRSADRLGALMSDWLGMKVEVVEFAGAWLPLPPDQRTRLSVNGAWCRLGVDAAAGVRAWDPQARIILRIGPLDLKGFQRLLPDRRRIAPAGVAGARLYRLRAGFAINPVLAALEVPPLLLTATADPPPRLGWNTWIPGPAGGVIHRQMPRMRFRSRGDRGAAGRLAHKDGRHERMGRWLRDRRHLLAGYYRHQSPAHMSLACLLGGVASPIPAPDDPVSYLELGCGQGFGAIDPGGEQPPLEGHRDRLQPGPYRGGARLGGGSRDRQVSFIEADLSTLAEDPAAARYRKPTSSACTACGPGFRPPCRRASCACCAAR